MTPSDSFDSATVSGGQLVITARESGRYSSVGLSTAGERSLTDLESQCPALTAQDLSATCP